MKSTKAKKSTTKSDDVGRKASKAEIKAIEDLICRAGYTLETIDKALKSESFSRVNTYGIDGLKEIIRNQGWRLQQVHSMAHASSAHMVTIERFGKMAGRLLTELDVFKMQAILKDIIST